MTPLWESFEGAGSTAATGSPSKLLVDTIVNALNPIHLGSKHGGVKPTKFKTKKGDKVAKKQTKKEFAEYKLMSKGRDENARKCVSQLRTPLKVVEAKEKALALNKAGYFDSQKDNKFDLKSAQQEIDNLRKEIQLAVGAIRAGLGDRPIRIRTPATMTITTTVTSGVTNTVAIGGSGGQVQPSLSNEWSALSTLFDEYKCFGGTAHFNYINGTNPAGAIRDAAVSVENMAVIAYAADVNTLPTTSIELLEHAQHKIIPTISVNNTSQYTLSHGTVHEFTWHTPRGAVVGPASNASGTQWTPTNDSGGAETFGWIKFHHIGQNIAATVCGAGFVIYDLEFRCRA